MLISYYSSINTITYSSLITYQIPFFTSYQSPARGCKAALCTPNPRQEKTYLQGSAPRGGGGGGGGGTLVFSYIRRLGSFFFFFLEGGGGSKCNAYKKY